MEDNVVRVAILPQLLNGIAIKISITWSCVFFFFSKISLGYFLWEFKEPRMTEICSCAIKEQS